MIKTYFPLVVIQKASLTLHIVISWESILGEIKIKKTAGPLVSLSAIKGPNQGCEDPYLYTPPHSLPVIFIRDSITIQTYILLSWLYIYLQWSVLEMWPTSFWAKLSPGANFEQEFPRTFCSPGFYLWLPYHHPWAGPTIIHAILTKISMWIPVAPPVRAAETHGN